MNDEDLIFFNNCKGTDHVRIYNDTRAFYDLSAVGPHSKLANGLLVGQQCVVCGKPDAKNVVAFGWYSLTDEYVATDGELDLECRVFAGDHMMTESLPKNVACEHPIYGLFFNVKRHFKQQVVLSRAVPFDERPDPLKKPVPDLDMHGVESSTGEGRKRLVMHIVRERDRKLVASKKASVKPAICEVCGFNSRETYDVDYCEVHHLTPLSDLEEGTKTKLDDLAIVCANCHRILHLQNPPMTLDELRGKLNHKR